MYGIAAQNFLPHKWLNHGELLNIGNLELEVKHCPGHTPGHIILINHKHKFVVAGDVIFKNSGFEWREPGCSMCLAMNADKLKPEERCASTSNRNFEGRQGRGGRTHLVSPGMAAAAAISGNLDDVRKYQN